MDVDSSKWQVDLPDSNCLSKVFTPGEPAEVPLGIKSGCAILLTIGIRLFYICLFHQPGVDHFLLESPLIAYFERRYFLLGD
jgi:hypothetical protein